MRFGGTGFNRQFGFSGFSQPVAASGGASFAAWPSLIGAEMMVNGDCSSGTGWFFGTGGSIAGGKMQLVAYGDTIDNDGIAAGLIVDATYRAALTIDTRTLGSIAWGSGLVGVARSTAGTFSQDIVASDTTANLSATSATMQLDNFSVKSVGLLGVEGDWTITGGDIFFNSNGTITFDGSTAGSKIELTGSAKTSFDAGVSNSTACTVTVYQDANDPQSGTVSVTMKDGTPVNFAFSGEVSITHTVTSGTGSGFILTAGNDNPGLNLNRVTITPA